MHHKKNDIFYTYQQKWKLLRQYASKNQNFSIRISVNFSTKKDSLKFLEYFNDAKSTFFRIHYNLNKLIFFHNFQI
jgi:hypothetical protein